MSFCFDVSTDFPFYTLFYSILYYSPFLFCFSRIFAIISIFDSFFLFIYLFCVQFFKYLTIQFFNTKIFVYQASIFGKIEIVGFDDKRIDAINPSSTYTVSFSSSFSLSANSSFSSSVSFSTFENESAGSSNLRNRNEKEINDDDVLLFFCRFMESNGSSSLQIVINQSAFKRWIYWSFIFHSYFLLFIFLFLTVLFRWKF